MGSMERLNPHAKKSTLTLPVEVHDRYNRALQVGDTVLAPEPADTRWTVKAIDAELDPRAQPNLVRVELVKVHRFHVQATKRVLDLVRVKTAEENGAAPSELQFFPPRVVVCGVEELARARRLIQRVPTRGAGDPGRVARKAGRDGRKVGPPRSPCHRASK